MSARLVEAVFVFDRNGASEVSVAYEILVPQRTARRGRPGGRAT